MRANFIFDWHYLSGNWALTPDVSIWRDAKGALCFAIHFLRGRIGFRL